MLNYLSVGQLSRVWKIRFDLFSSRERIASLINTRYKLIEHVIQNKLKALSCAAAAGRQFVKTRSIVFSNVRNESDCDARLTRIPSGNSLSIWYT